MTKENHFKEKVEEDCHDWRRNEFDCDSRRQFPNTKRAHTSTTTNKCNKI